MRKDPRIILRAAARWDAETEPTNAGWVVDVTYLDGQEDILTVPPFHYYAPQSADPQEVLASTLEWHNLIVKAD